MGQALQETIDALADDPDAYTHLLGVVGEWIERDEVAAELTQVIDPRPDAEIDISLLHREFDGMDFQTANASTDADARMKLADVYVALDTTTRVDEERDVRKPDRDSSRSGKTRALSTLEALVTSGKMVLLGDPEGGKSTFVNHLSLCLAPSTGEDHET